MVIGHFPDKAALLRAVRPYLLSALRYELLIAVLSKLLFKLLPISDQR